MNPSNRAHGVHGDGGRTYTATEGRALSSVLQQHIGCQCAITVEELADATRVGGRAVRQFLSDYDGVWFLLGGGDDGYYLCEWTDEAEKFTRRIQSQINTMLARVTRRTNFAQRLPTMQVRLFVDGA